jgi:hypothetical protein
MSKLDRLKNLPGAKVSGKEKPALKAADLGQLVKVNAINGLKEMMVEKHRAPSDYEISFERDERTNLFKTPIVLSAKPKRMH